MSFTSSPTETRLQLGDFPLLNAFSCVSQVFFHLPYKRYTSSIEKEEKAEFYVPECGLSYRFALSKDVQDFKELQFLANNCAQ